MVMQAEKTARKPGFACIALLCGGVNSHALRLVRVRDHSYCCQAGDWGQGDEIDPIL